MRILPRLKKTKGGQIRVVLAAVLLGLVVGLYLVLAGLS